jgi:hypothetical protein
MKNTTFFKRIGVSTAVTFVLLTSVLFQPAQVSAQIFVTTSVGSIMIIRGLPPALCDDPQPNYYISTGNSTDLEAVLPQGALALQNAAQGRRVRVKTNQTYQVEVEVFTINVAPVLQQNGANYYYFNAYYGTTEAPLTATTIEFSQNTPANAAYNKLSATVQFPKGSTGGYLILPYAELTTFGVFQTNITIPFVVGGSVEPQFPILGTTVDPQFPYLILHAPPGDGSSSEFQESKTTCREFQNSFAEDGSSTASASATLGVAGSAGFIATVDFELSVTISGSTTAGAMSIQTSSNQTCVTVNEGFSTTELTGPNGGGDVFIGYGIDLAYGINRYVAVDQNTCTAFLDTGLIYMPIGDPRRFAYTKTAILSDIELLQTLAENTLLSSRERNIAQNQIDVWNQVLAINDANINNPNNVALTPVAFSSGVNQFQESSITVTESNSIQYEHYLEGTVGLEAVVETGGSGVSGGFEYKSSKRYGKTQNQSDETAQLIRYTLADDDTGDVFNLDVVRDPMFGTPVFRTKAGTKSSCPYQGGYQRDQPKLKHDGSTNNTITLLGNPVGGTATFLIDICNESNEPRKYLLKLNANSNPNNAEVRVTGALLNGNDLGQLFTVPANGCLENYEVSVKQANQLAYPDLELFLYPECNEDDIQSNIFASVYFGSATAVNTPADDRLLSIYPNPVSDLLYVRLPEGHTMDAIRLMDVTGKTILASAASTPQTELNMATLPKGVYAIQVQSGNQFFTKKVFIQ